jgi:2-phospho-L-lactate guanylyltransferase
MIAALVPAKALAQAKGRLAALLSDEERRRLVFAMLEDVLRALAAVPRIGLRAVVSPDADLLAQAQRLGALTIAEPIGVRGINQALSYAVGVLAGRDLDALLVFPLDVPAIVPAEVEAIIDALPAGRGVVLCPSAARGTSALALRPPDAIPFRFGQHSFMAHRREANARGLPLRVLRIPSLAMDIDGPQDLLDLLARPADTATHRLLAEIGLAQRQASTVRRPA